MQLTGCSSPIHDVTFWMYRIQILKIQPEPEADSVIAAALLCMLMMCVKVCNLCINCNVLMAVIWFELLLHTAVHNICLFECQCNDLELTRFYDIHASEISGAIQNFGCIGNQISTYLASRNCNWISSTFIILIQILLAEVDVGYHSGDEHSSQLRIHDNVYRCEVRDNRFRSYVLMTCQS